MGAGANTRDLVATARWVVRHGRSFISSGTPRGPVATCLTKQPHRKLCPACIPGPQTRLATCNHPMLLLLRALVKPPRIIDFHIPMIHHSLSLRTRPPPRNTTPEALILRHHRGIHPTNPHFPNITLKAPATRSSPAIIHLIQLAYHHRRTNSLHSRRRRRHHCCSSQDTAMNISSQGQSMSVMTVSGRHSNKGTMVRPQGLGREEGKGIADDEF